MTQEQILEVLKKTAGSSPYGEEIIGRIASAFERDPSLDLSAVLYWLDEKAYYLMAWERRHQEEGQMEKASQEQQENILVQNCIAALKKANE